MTSTADGHIVVLIVEDGTIPRHIAGEPGVGKCFPLFNDFTHTVNIGDEPETLLQRIDRLTPIIALEAKTKETGKNTALRHVKRDWELRDRRRRR